VLLNGASLFSLGGRGERELGAPLSILGARYFQGVVI